MNIEPRVPDALRELFSARADGVPATDDLASIAVSRARRIARRRMSIGGLAAMIAFALTLGTAVSLRGWWITDESGGLLDGPGGPTQFDLTATATADAATAPPVALWVDIRDGDRIYDAVAGRWLKMPRPVTGAGDEVTVVRVATGWLAGDVTGVRLVRSDGSVVPLLSGEFSWTVNADGTQIASVQHDTLALDQITADGIRPLASTVVAVGERPIGFFASNVLLATPGNEKVGVWSPESTYRNLAVNYVFPSSQIQTVGLVTSPGSGTPCLAMVSAAGGTVHKVGVAGCHELLAQGVGRAAVSPDGTHLATPFKGGMWIINLARSAAASKVNPAAAPVWVTTCASDATATPVWQDTSTVITSSQGTVVACSVDGSQRRVALPAGVPASGTLIPISR